jgi:ribosome maturation factor RimP
MIEATLAERFPEVELVDLEVRGGPAGTLALFVDRPGGVDLELCAAVSQALDDVRERYSLEVSSPGLDRRLRKPAHFAAALGRDVAVKLAAPQDGRSNFRGTLAAADADSITLELDGGSHVTLPLQGIAKAHVVYNFDTDGGHRE